MKLTILKNTDLLVLIGVAFDDALDSISHPGFLKDTAHIRVTKGNQNTITLFTNEAKRQTEFSFGDGGTTLISDNLKHLKKTVIYFLLSKGINIHNKTSKRETDLKIMYWPNRPDEELAVHLGGTYAARLSRESTKEVFGDYAILSKEVAPTGCIVEKAEQLVSHHSDEPFGK